MPSIPCMGLMKHSYEFSKNCHTIFSAKYFFRNVRLIGCEVFILPFTTEVPS